jgi:class 3 adenylate cyclase
MLQHVKFPGSYRTRLVLVLFPLVAGVAIGALLLAEWKFAATYQRRFEDQFENQIAAVTEAKTRRFDALSSVLAKLAEHPQVLAAMAAGDSVAAARVLVPPLEALAASRLQSEFGLPQRPGGAEDRRSERLRTPGPPFIALLDREGAFVTGLRERGAAPAAAEREDEVRRGTRRISWLEDRHFSEILHEQQVGYLIVEAAGREQVREVFVVPLRDEARGGFLGALAFGLPLPAMAERALFERTGQSGEGQIESGIYVEGRLVSNTVPASHRGLVEETLAEALAGSDESRREIILPIAGVRHRLIYRVLNPDSPFPRAVQVNFYSLAALDAEVDDLRRGTAGLVMAVLMTAWFLVAFVSRGLSGPVSRLVAAAHDIEQGNYDVRVPVTRDEVGRLALAFNEMAAGLALQEKYRSVLNAVADRHVAERLIENREALSGELRNVSILFCDIRGFTRISEQMPPQELIVLLNSHMTALTRVAYEHGGMVDKFVGDLIMVLFGAPMSSGRDAERAVECARAMLAERRRMNEGAPHPLEVGIGIATGDVVAGCMGSEQRLSYTVLGHRVNLASRLCSVAGPGEIMTDAETAHALPAHIPVSVVEPMRLKGLSEPVEVCRVS